MFRVLFALALSLIVAGATFAALIADHLAGWSRRPLAPHGDTAAFVDVVSDRIANEANGNAVFVLLENGRPVADFAISRGRPVDLDTRFQVASLSKWVTAFGVMTLVEDGALDLDAPVSTYLTRWSLPPSAFDNDAVTVRRLLSHTAGLDDGLGYAGFAPGEELQGLEASLTQASDASPGATGAVRVSVEPGAGFAYSGGGYTLLQLLVEEVSGQSFNDYMRQAVFTPLGMSNTTYVLEDHAANVAEFYDRDGGLATHYRFTALAAASLYTSVNDMARFIQAHLPGADDEAPGRGLVSPRALEEMREPLAYELGAPIWGMGVMLYAPNDAGSYTIGHDGNNEPAINTAVRFDPATGDGVVVLETGNALLATTIAGDWVFWNTKKVDFVTATIEIGGALLRAAVAALIAFVGSLMLFLRLTRRT